MRYLTALQKNNKGGGTMEKPKIFIEIYGGLVNRIVSSIDADFYVISEDSKAKTFEDLG